MAANPKTTNKRRASKPSPEPAPSRPSAAVDVAGTLVDLARQVRSWTDSVLGVAGAAAEVTMGAAKMVLPRAGRGESFARTGAVLRRMREAAGLSLAEVGSAINLADPTLLDLVENGKMALPFEIILRLASVLGRNDPLSFVMRFTRSYNPEVWKTLEALGVGRLVLQAGREREFANLYRASDDARRLDDEQFAEVLKFTRAAFEMALSFAAAQARTPRRAKPTGEISK